MPNIELINRIKKYICQDPSRTHSTFKNDFPVNSEEISSSYFSVIKTALKKKGYKIEGMTVKTKKKPEQKVQKKETDSGSHRFVPGVTVKIPEKINTGSQIFLENPAREALKKSREDLETARAGYV